MNKTYLTALLRSPRSPRAESVSTSHAARVRWRRSLGPIMLAGGLALGACSSDALSSDPARGVRDDPNRAAAGDDDEGDDAQEADGAPSEQPSPEPPADRSTKPSSEPRDAAVGHAEGGMTTLDAAADAAGASRNTEGGPAHSDTGVSDGATATSPASACTDKPGTKRGKSVERIMAGGTMRSFVMHRPANLDPNRAAALVIVPHGYTQTGEDMYRITKYWELGEKEGIVTLYPEGASYSGPWNVGRPSCQSTLGVLPLGSGNDQAFLEEMVKFVERDQCLDRKRIFIAGFSMGAYFSNTSACSNDIVTAIAPHSGGSHDFSACKGEPKPVILFHGNGDRLIPYDCGIETRKRWVARNGCSNEVDVKEITNGRCEYHKGCMENAQVVFCTLNGMNHGWAGGPTQQVAVYPDDYPKYHSSTQLSWEFFKTYVR